MKKIAYITTGKIGIHRFTYNELLELQKSGIEFILCLTQLNKGPWMPDKNWPCIVASKRKALLHFLMFLFQHRILLSLFFIAIRTKSLRFFLVALSFYPELKRQRINSLHCQMGDKKLYIGYYLKKLLNLPLTVTVHAHELYQPDVYVNRVKIQKLYNFCDKVITISDFNYNILQNEIGVEKNKLEIMRLFPVIDPKNVVREKTKILMVANWAEKKGYLTLFEAIKNINRDDFVMWIVGGSYYSTNSIDLYKLVPEYGLSDKVVLLGRLGETVLDIVYSSCDIFCLPSYTEYDENGNPVEREGIPVALMEAMAWGKPVISTIHAGIPELVKEKLVEERNPKELQKAIEYLLDHKEKWADMGRANQAVIKEKYTQQNVQKLVDVFKRL